MEVVVPDADARAAFGDNAMDPASRLPAARAGYEHGKELGVDLLAGVWG